MDKLEALEALIAAADAGSFAAGGRRLGKSRDYVSKAVAELEERLGRVLVHRTTRQTVLTEAGEAYVREVRPLVEGIQAAERRAASDVRGASGKIVVNAPLMWGMAVLSPLIVSFMELNPHIEVDLRLSDEISPLAPPEVDVTLRLAASVDPDSNVLRFGEVKRAVLAAPNYLEQHGPLRNPQCLLKHECLLYGNLATGTVWVLKRKGEVQRVPVSGKFSCNNGAILAALAASGHGIVMLPEFVAAPYLSNASLVPVLDGFEPLPLTLHAIVPPSRQGLERVRSLLRHLRIGLLTAR